ncbi:hypothetical protein ACIOEW_28525 [Streptomyces sp. NPDC087901]|uniref:hypothetical protein n=1 Tax=unclassified Streptomyces TaxID=2593676 RepID=UPI0034422873
MVTPTIVVTISAARSSASPSPRLPPVITRVRDYMDALAVARAAVAAAGEPGA